MLEESFQIIRIVLGSLFVLFIPGFVWTFVFFKKDEIDVIERIALSFGLSIALVPLLIFYLNYLLGIKITFINSSIAILLLTLIPIGILFAKKRGLIPNNIIGFYKTGKYKTGK